MSSLVGKDVRTGTQPCFDRFVIELQAGPNPISSAFPGYFVRYASGTTVDLNPSGQPVTIKGGAVLLASLGSWMTTMEGAGYHGSQDFFPTNVSAIKEVRLIEDFESQSTWAIGLDAKRNFTVTILGNPSRLVVDFQTAP